VVLISMVNTSTPFACDVYAIPTAPNVCNQVLREVIALPGVSMAHVIMDKGNASLPHEHNGMAEIYFIIQGEGVLYHGEEATAVSSDACVVIPPKTRHMLKNSNRRTLEHLVFAVPPFNAVDVHLTEAMVDYPEPKSWKYDGIPVTAQDGAIIQEYLSRDERKELGIAIAVGALPPNRFAVPHVHRISDEVYFILGGHGMVQLNDFRTNVRAGSIVYVPKGTVHALENMRRQEELNVLCLSSPAYIDEDFVRVSK
jgi:mannose-6-phosphate isomerase-like protein (cupin superfamily)